MHRNRPISLILLLAVMLAAASGGCGGSGAVGIDWKVDSRYTIYGISALQGGEAWAVGEDGIILHREDGGGNWVVRDSGIDTTLRSVSALDRSHVWAVGEKGAILFYDGTDWSVEDGGGDLELDCVSARAADDVWACGWGTVRHYDGDRWEESWGGDEAMRGITATGHRTAVAVGSNGTVLRLEEGDWSIEESGTDIELTAVCASGDSEAWACGLDGTVLHYDGAWKKKRGGDEMLRGITVGAGGDVWVVGYTTRSWSLPFGSVALRFDGSWRRVEIDDNLYPTCVSTSREVYVSGLGGVAEGDAP